MQFLSAPLLFGLVLAGLPILIHLLNRRRFQLVEWAPMKYLKLTIRSNRRRMRIEQLILLLLRTLLMILLVLTVARPVLARSGLGAWLARRARVSRIIVLDDSLSSGYRQDGRLALALAKDAATEVLRSTGAQDSVTFLTTTPASDPLVREASLDDPTKLAARIEALQPTDAACNWAATFKTIDDCLSTATFPQKEVILITDLRKSGWNAEVTDFANRWAARGVEAKVIDIGSRNTANVSLQKFVQEDSLALPGAPVKFQATIRNDTTSAINGAQAVLAVDGESRPLLLPDLPSGGATDLPLSITFDKPGQHSLQLTLPDDPLAGDNTRYLTVNVREKLDLTIVDGRQGAGAFESAGDFLNVAFTVGKDPWQVRHLGDSDPQTSWPKRTDVMCITDAASLTPEVISEYEKRVRLGMGLMIFAGEQVDPQFYNDRLYKNGTGLLPARIDRVLDGPVRGLVVEGFADSPLAPMAKLVPAAIAKVETRRLLGVEVPSKENDQVRILARWNDAEGHPAVVEKRLGRGRVLLWTTSADREWTDWPVDPTYVLAVRSAAVATAWPDSSDDSLTAGHPLQFADDQIKSNPRIILPQDPTPQPLAFDHATVRYPHTQRAGIYTLTWTDASGTDQQHKMSVSFDKTASDLEPLDEASLAQLMGNLHAEVVRYSPGRLASAGPGREIWRMLATTMLALLFVETLLAFWVGRER